MSVRVTDLDPKTGDLCLLLLKGAMNSGIRLRVVEGLRSMDEQAALYAKGRFRPGEPCHHWNGWRAPGTCKVHPFGLVVTNAKPGESAHNWGMAFDVAFETPDGHLAWEGPWETVGAIGERLGLAWGGHWPKLVDRPHFELKDWRNLIPKEKL